MDAATLILAVVALVVGQAVTVFLVIRGLTEANARAAAERATLLQRLQDPANAVALHSMERIQEAEAAVEIQREDALAHALPLDDDEALNDYIAAQRRERESWA